jgi:hypothetical protein
MWAVGLPEDIDRRQKDELWSVIRKLIKRKNLHQTPDDQIESNSSPPDPQAD